MDIVERLRDTKHHPWEICQDAADEIARLRDELTAARKTNSEWLAANGPGGWINDLRVENERLRDELENLRKPAKWRTCATHGDDKPNVWGCPECLRELRDENANLTHENDKLWAELNACAASLPGPYYMDPPDGGSVTVAEQVARMAKDAARYRWLKSMAFEQDDTYIVFPEISAWDYQLGPQLNEKFPTLDAAIDAAMQKGE